MAETIVEDQIVPEETPEEEGGSMAWLIVIMSIVWAAGIGCMIYLQQKNANAETHEAQGESKQEAESVPNTERDTDRN